MIFHFFNGVVATGLLIAALFFFRFWQRTGDSLFAAFAMAFLLFTLNQALITLSGVPREEQSWIYLLRLAGFASIVAAIVVKNIRGGTPP